MSDVLFGLGTHFFGNTSGDATVTDSDFGGVSPTAEFHMMVTQNNLGYTSNVKTIIGASEGINSGDLWCFMAANEDFSILTSVLVKQLQIKSHYNWDFLGGNRELVADFVSFGTNSATYNVSETTDKIDYINAVLLCGGTDLDTKVGIFDVGNTNVGNTEVVVTGIDMSGNCAIIIFGNQLAMNFGSVNTDPQSAFGHMIGLISYDGTTIRQGCFVDIERDNLSTTAPFAKVVNNRAIVIIDDSDGSLVSSAEVTSLSSTGFTLTVRDANMPMNHKFGYLALSLPSDWKAHVSIEDMPTSVSNPTSFTPSGVANFTPQILIQVLSLLEAENTLATDDQAGGGAMRFVTGLGSQDERCITWDIEDNITTTDTRCGVLAEGRKNEHDGTEGYQMSLNGFQNGGWNDDFASVHANVKKTVCLIMGEDTVFDDPFHGNITQTKLAVRQASTI